jgi:hypothetical protein
MLEQKLSIYFVIPAQAGIQRDNIPQRGQSFSIDQHCWNI